MKKRKGVVTSLDKLGFIDELRKVFYQNTGLIISFFHPKRGQYDFYPKFERNEYCKLLQSTSEGLKRCLKSDRDALDKAKRDMNYCLYECHAGLTNAVINLEYKGVEIGSIFTGQVLTTKPGENQFESIFKEVEQTGIPYKKLKEAYFNTRVLDVNKLIIGVDLLNVMSNYIISVEDEFYLQNEVLQKDKEILEYKNKEMELENELQKLKISFLEWDYRKSEPDRNSHRVETAQDFIRHNYHKKINLNDVAESVYLSSNYFSSLFKDISGYSFSKYLQKTRIDAAKKLLLNSNLTIKEIVHAVGFEDYNYFNRVFSKHEGLPPSEFQSSNRKIIQTLERNI